jgi:hypothetical protein
MRIDFKINFGKPDKGYIAIMFIHHIAPLLCHSYRSTPLFLPRVLGGLVWYIVAVVNNDRDFCQLQ